MDSNSKFRARSAIATCRILARPFDVGAPGQSLHYLIMQSLLAASETAQVVAQESPLHCLRNAESRQRRAEMSTCVIIQSANWRQRLLCGGVDAGACDVAPVVIEEASRVHYRFGRRSAERADHSFGPPVTGPASPGQVPEDRVAIPQ